MNKFKSNIRCEYENRYIGGSFQEILALHMQENVRHANIPTIQHLTGIFSLKRCRLSGCGLTHSEDGRFFFD